VHPLPGLWVVGEAEFNTQAVVGLGLKLRADSQAELVRKTLHEAVRRDPPRAWRPSRRRRPPR
jgi:hypothetical protein